MQYLERQISKNARARKLILEKIREAYAIEVNYKRTAAQLKFRGLPNLEMCKCAKTTYTRALTPTRAHTHPTSSYQPAYKTS